MKKKETQIKPKHSTIEQSDQSKEIRTSKRGLVRPLLEQYYSVISGKKELLDTRKLDSLCEYFLKCAQNCESTKHVSYYLKSPDAPFKVEVRTLENWLHKYPNLKDAYNELMEAIGDKLREDVLKSKIPHTLIHKDLNLYCDRYKKLFEWEHGIKNKPEDNSKSYVVVMEQTKDCPNVPKLEPDESDD